MALTDSIHSMRAAAEASLYDVCLLGIAPQEGGLEPGHLPVAWGTTPVKCGVTISTPREAKDGSQVDLGTILIRFAYTQDLTGVTHIRLTTRMGTALPEPEDYALEGTPGYGSTVRFAQAQRVTGGSVK